MTQTQTQKDILLAEDDQEDVLIFETALNDLNISYMLRHAENGEKLFILLKDRIPYLLFLDINMPFKDGVTCILEIRKNRDYDRMPVIMYTSNNSERVIEDCYTNGANLYMHKAFTLSALKNSLSKVFAMDWSNYMHYPSRSNFVLS